MVCLFFCAAKVLQILHICKPSGIFLSKKPARSCVFQFFVVILHAKLELYERILETDLEWSSLCDLYRG